MDINIKQIDKSVQVGITFYCGFAGKYEYILSHNLEHPSTAGLVAQAMHEQFTSQIAAIRKDAYEQGWKDKTQRKKKRTWFDSCFNRIKMD